ncbi:unnamed protein product [Discula destructiva]
MPSGNPGPFDTAPLHLGNDRATREVWYAIFAMFARQQGRPLTPNERRRVAEDVMAQLAVDEAREAAAPMQTPMSPAPQTGEEDWVTNLETIRLQPDAWFRTFHIGHRDLALLNAAPMPCFELGSSSFLKDLVSILSLTVLEACSITFTY